MFFLVFVLFLDCFFNMHLCAKLQPYRSKKFNTIRNNRTSTAIVMTPHLAGKSQRLLLLVNEMEVTGHSFYERCDFTLSVAENSEGVAINVG